MQRGCPTAATALFVALGAALIAPGDAVAGGRVHTVSGGTDRDTEYTLVHPSARRMSIIERRVVKPAATVARPMSEQPVHPDLFEVRIVHTTVWIDPDKEMIRNVRYRIDHNHAIPAAQRLAHSLRGGGAYTATAPRDNGDPPRMSEIRRILLPAPGPRTPELAPRAVPVSGRVSEAP